MAFLPGPTPSTPTGEREVVLLVDTFNTYFEPDNARAALRVLEELPAIASSVPIRRAADHWCCGRSFLLLVWLTRRARKPVAPPRH